MCVTTPMAGRAIAARSAMFPAKRAPISVTTISAASGALSSVSGSPASLLYDAGLACTRRDPASAAAVRSFVAVFPAEPVMPTTVAWPRRVRASRPASLSAAAGSATLDHGRIGTGRGRVPRDDCNGCAARECIGHEVVAVTGAPDREEARARSREARVDGPRRRADVGRPGHDVAADSLGDLARRQLHGPAPSSSRATARSSKGTVTPSAVWPVS